MNEPVRWLEDHEKWTGPRNRGLPPGGGGGDNEGMEARVQILEQTMTDVRERLARIETRLEQTTTKEDAAKMETSIIKWFIGTAVVLSALAFTAAAVIK